MINQLSKIELKEFQEIEVLFFVVPMEIKRTNNYTANATLSGGGFEEISGQLGRNSLLEVAKARKEVYLKESLKKMISYNTIKINENLLYKDAITEEKKEFKRNVLNEIARNPKRFYLNNIGLEILKIINLKEGEN